MKDPQIITTLERLAADNGGLLLPETVVETARDEDSPLHGQFEWDDSIAAQQHRIEQARRLIRVVVKILPGREAEPPTHVFVSLSTDRAAGGYRPLVTVLSDEEQRACLLADAYKEMESFRRKYGHLKELADVVSVIERAAVAR